MRRAPDTREILSADVYSAEVGTYAKLRATLISGGEGLRCIDAVIEEIIPRFIIVLREVLSGCCFCFD